MLDFVTLVLAVFAVWEYLLSVVPLRVPSWLQPALVAGIAIGAQYASARVVEVAAVTGAAALCHAAVSAREQAALVPRRRRSQLPPL